MAQTRGRNTPPEPIPPALWAAIPLLAGLALQWAGLPALPLAWLALLAGGLTAQPPTARRRTDQPDPRKRERYLRWKDILAGLSPTATCAGTVKDDPDGDGPTQGRKGRRQWWQPRRLYWWVALTIWMPFSLHRACDPTQRPDGMCPADPFATVRPALIPLNLLFGFMTVMGVVHMLDRRKDRRHVCTGVSVASFWTKAPTWARTLAIILPTMAATATATAAIAGTMPTPLAIWLPLIVMAATIRITDGKRQTTQWRRTIRFQQLVDTWTDDDGPLAKDWADARVTSCRTIGPADNPLTVLRIAVADATRPLKSGVAPLRPLLDGTGYDYARILGARKGKGDAATFDPRIFRLALGRDDTCVPDITARNAGTPTATLVLELAYAQCGEIWGKTAPLLNVTDVSADDKAAAWLATMVMPANGPSADDVTVNWLNWDVNPSGIVHLPEFTDVGRAFHLYADPATALSPAGNRFRTPGAVTSSRSFDKYVRLSRRFKDEHARWQDACGKRLDPPSPIYDTERTLKSDGWTAVSMRMDLPAGTGLAPYATLDMSGIDPDARFVGFAPQDDGAVLVVASGNVPGRVDAIATSGRADRLLVQAIVYKAIVNLLPARCDIRLGLVTQEGKDFPMWRIPISLTNGATIADLRHKQPALQAQAGARNIYWEWKSANEAALWMCDRPRTSLDDLPHWRRRSRQRELIPLVLSEAWGASGIIDRSGRSPEALSIGTLPNNPKVIRARFRIPTGIDMARVTANQEKFATAAGYAYTRILPTGDDNGADTWDMLLADHDPFPTMASADWAYADRCDDHTYPLGVDDMGDPVLWNIKHTPHLLVMGKTGTGKTSAVQIPVAEALRKHHQVIIIDPMKGAIDFTHWAKRKSLAFIGNNQMREAEATVAWVTEEMSRRVELLSAHGVGNIDLLDPKDRPRRIFIVWDEFNSYLGEIGKTTANPLKDLKIANANAAISAKNNSIQRTFSDLAAIAVQGRTAGIHLILAGQRLTMDDFKQMAGNGNAFYRTLGRLLLGSDAPAGVVSQQNLREANRLQSSMKTDGRIPAGRAIYESAEGRLSAVQTWYGGGQDRLAELVASAPDSTPIDYTPYMPKEVAQYGQIRSEELPVHAKPEISETDVEAAISEALAGQGSPSLADWDLDDGTPAPGDGDGKDRTEPDWNPDDND